MDVDGVSGGGGAKPKVSRAEYTAIIESLWSKHLEPMGGVFTTADVQRYVASDFSDKGLPAEEETLRRALVRTLKQSFVMCTSEEALALSPHAFNTLSALHTRKVPAWWRRLTPAEAAAASKAGEAKGGAEEDA